MRDLDDSFDELFRAHHPTVRDYVRRRVTGEMVDDVVSETFIVAWRRADHVPADPLPWLLSVARNTIRTARRGENRRARLLAKAQSTHVDSHDEIRAREESRGDAVTALARLNDQDREILSLIAWEGLTPSQAADVLGIPATRFRVRLHRARRRLQWAIDADAAEAGEPASPDRTTFNHSTNAIA